MGPPRRPTTSRTRPTAVSKRPPPRERSIHPPRPGQPRIPRRRERSPALPQPWERCRGGGRAGRRPATRTDHNTRTTRGNVQVAGTAKTGTRTGGPHAAGGHGVGAGEQGRVGPGAHHRPSATRPAAPHGDGMGQTARAPVHTRPFHHRHRYRQPPPREPNTSRRRHDAELLPRVIPPRTRSEEARAAVGERTKPPEEAGGQAEATRTERRSGRAAGGHSGEAPPEHSTRPSSPDS